MFEANTFQISFGGVFGASSIEIAIPREVFMIRNSDSADRLAVKALADAIGFEATVTAEVLSSFDACHKPSNPSSALWFVDDDQGVKGMAYIEPERMTDGTYNLMLIAVHPDEQRKGRGTRLIHHVEEQLARNGGRVLVIETMGTDDFSHVRRLYSKLGFAEEARIRDFYGEGYDKVVFWKKPAQSGQQLSREMSEQSQMATHA